MKLSTVTMLIYVVAALALIAVPALAKHHAVMVEEDYSYNKRITDTEGMTLYWYKKDSMNKSACAGPCLKNWPIFYREKVAPPEGVSASDFATLTRSDGKMQTTFRSYPLYYFIKDKNAGDTKGDGKGRVWFVVDPNNFPK